MKILYYDCFSGISGDMNLGAMIDLGIDKAFLTNELGKLGLKGWSLVVNEDQRHGIRGTKVTVKQTGHEHAHRHLSDIEKIIDASVLNDDIKSLSKKIFHKIAYAEASVHGVPVEKIHFHEVGAIDSIIDIVGAAICFCALKVDEVHTSVIELGSGFVKCDHGKLPVPAPATIEILKGIPAKKGGVDFEATTPTGAAIIATLGTVFNSECPVKIEKTAYGIGHKEHNEVPNLLRVFLGESEGTPNTGHEAVLFQCNIDDMNPEFYEYISDKLFKAGASDVYYSNIIMKKGRPGVILNIICEKEYSEAVRNIVFSESSTLGIRSFSFKKDTLARSFETINTEYGQVEVKRSFYQGTEVSVKPEYDDCKRIAAETGIPIKVVFENILSAARNSKKSN
jgi:pyridinium-3,5-bisthiocarboxylic acid mononucleotide nickel chelatase